MPKNLEQTVGEIRFPAPSKLIGYLTVLARDTMLGATFNEVALALLTVEAERRLADGYHVKGSPPVAEPKADG